MERELLRVQLAGSHSREKWLLKFYGCTVCVFGICCDMIVMFLFSLNMLLVQRRTHFLNIFNGTCPREWQ